MRPKKIAAVPSMPLAPLAEEPTLELFEQRRKDKKKQHYYSWNALALLRSFLRPNASVQRPDLRLLIGVLGCPLSPIELSSDSLPKLSIKYRFNELSSAQYIVHQYIAATGCRQMEQKLKSAYVAGEVQMSMHGECEERKAWESGCFVMWQMMKNIWSVELCIGGTKVRAGCDGSIVWRQLPWLGSHAAKGPPRPLRRALQGLDPQSVATLFLEAECVGEKKMGEEECFVLKVSASAASLAERNEGPAEILKHVMLGYFSQRSGLLVEMEDSHLTRIEINNHDPVYWETTMQTSISDYRDIDGVMIAHSGRSSVSITRFGEGSMDQTISHLEECWHIHDLVFNVPGLSIDSFIPPSDLIPHHHLLPSFSS